MATAAVHKTKRVRPADGGMEWKEEFHAFYCWGCHEYEEVRSSRDREPDKLAELHELYIIDHTECWEFDDPEMAAEARKYRKEKKRRENLAKGRTGIRDQGVLDCSQWLRGRR